MRDSGSHRIISTDKTRGKKIDAFIFLFDIFRESDFFLSFSYIYIMKGVATTRKSVQFVGLRVFRRATHTPETVIVNSTS
jgi:hypothetical protein